MFSTVSSPANIFKRYEQGFYVDICVNFEHDSIIDPIESLGPRFGIRHHAHILTMILA